MKIISVIKQYIDFHGIKPHAFEKSAYLSNGYIANTEKSGGKIYNKVLEKIYAAYPDLENIIELAYRGADEKQILSAIKGDKSSEADIIRQNKAIGQREKKKVPILGDAAAGTEIEINTTDLTYPDQYIDVGDLLRDSEAAFTVYGNSMTPNYPSGSVLGLKRNYDGFIQPGEIYVLETKSNRVFKRLYWNEDHTAYVCISDNTMTHEAGPRKGKYFYEPFEVPVNEAVRIFDVTGMIKRTRNSGIIQRIN